LRDEPGGLPFAQMMAEPAGSTQAQDLGQPILVRVADESGAANAAGGVVAASAACRRVGISTY